jgi:putative phosphoribosyl transferase
MENRIVAMAAADEDSWPGRFADRQDAGCQLAAQLLPLAALKPVVVALPRGGVPVGAEISTLLGARLEILAVRKLGAPQNPEYGIGAIAEDGTRVFDSEALTALRIDGETLESIVAEATEEVRRRVAVYRGDRARLPLENRIVIVVDDGVATGVTDTVALRAIRHQGPRRLILAVPVCAADSADALEEEADAVVCLNMPPLLYGVGHWYRDFSQVSDREVVAALRENPNAKRRIPPGGCNPAAP